MREVAEAIRLARDEPTFENLEAMWRHVLRLPAWYLLPAALEAETTPLVAQLDDGDWILAFTHFRALNTFARERNMRSDNGDIPMLAVPPLDAVERISQLADHIDGILFNLGTDLAFRAPPNALTEFARRFPRRRRSVVSRLRRWFGSDR